MNNNKKTLKSPLSANNVEVSSSICKGCKARIAGEAQKSLAKEVYSRLEYAIIRVRDTQETQIAVYHKLIEVKKFLHDFLKKPQ